MAGKPGMKGGGGARPGAGRKKKAPEPLNVAVPVADMLAHKDPKVFLLALMNDQLADVKLRADAAKALMPFMHSKKGESVKGDKADAAKKAASGRFGSAAPPRLAAAGGKRVA